MKLGKWAKGDTAIITSSRPPPKPTTLQPPAPPPAPVLHPSGTPIVHPSGAILVQLAPGTSHRPIEPVSTVPSDGCSIVKGDQKHWNRVLDGLPDLAKQAGIDYSNGVDAVRDFVSIPEGAVMAHWTANSRYYNGQTDRSAKNRLDRHINQHGDSIESIRQSRSTVIDDINW